MQKEWIAPIAGIVGALIGGLVAILNNYVPFSRQEKQKGREEHLRHIEEIFDSLDTVESSLIYFYTNYTCLLFQGKVEELKHHPDTPLGRLELLVRLYCPTLGASFQRLEQIRDKCGGHFASAILSFATKDNRKMASELQAITQTLKELTTHCEGMRADVIDLVAKKGSTASPSVASDAPHQKRLERQNKRHT